MCSSGRFLDGSKAITASVFNGGFLIDDPQSYFFIFLTDFFLLPKSFLVHGKHISIFLNISPSFFGLDNFVKQNLILAIDLNQIFLWFMVVGSNMPFVEKIHVAGIRHIKLWFFVDYAVNTFEVAGVVILVVEVGVATGVGWPVVVECFLHKEEELYSIAILSIDIYFGEKEEEGNKWGGRAKRFRMKKESAGSRFGKTYLHFSASEHAVVQISNSPEAILDLVEFYQGHLLVSRLPEDVHWLQVSIIAEDIVEGILVADLFFEGRDVKGVGGRVDSYWLFLGESRWGEEYLSKD